MATDITKLSLNSMPTDLDFEDFISSHSLLGGCILDRSIHEKLDGVKIAKRDVYEPSYYEKWEKTWRGNK